MKKIFAFIFIALAAVGCGYDDGDLWNKVDDLDGRVATLEEKVGAMNDDITAMQTIVKALGEGSVITEVKTSAEGHEFVLSDGKTISIRHGSDGDKGNDGVSPVIGIGLFEGTYYWTRTIDTDTQWLTDDDGNKIPVAGKDGSAGATPAMGVDQEGYWTVDTGEGPARITDSAGQPIKAQGASGDSFFKYVVDNGDSVTFTLNDDSSVTLAKAVSIAFEIECSEKESFAYGAVRTFVVNTTGVEELAISKPDGWRVNVSAAGIEVTAPDAANPYAEKAGKISFTAVGKKSTVIAHINVQVYYLMDFESIDEGYLAGPTSYGGNCYSAYSGSEGQIYGSYDAGSDLMMPINEAYGSYDMWNGATFASRWNDMTVSGYQNQCSVYYKDPATGFGGHNGSETFGVSFGYVSEGSTSPYKPKLHFLDDQTEIVFDHFWVMNNTYAALSMEQGDSFAKQFSYDDQDWFKLTIEGFDKSGTSTGTVEFYLADFRTPSSPGVVKEWSKVDLHTLGAVNKLEFNLSSSDVGQYGMNTPAYFCFDDVALRK